MTVVEELLALSQPRLVAFVLALARVAGLFLIAPVLASRATPLRVRAALVFFLTVTMLPLLARTAAPAAAMTGPLALLGSMLLETSLGFAIGMVAQLIMGAVQMAGQLVGIQMGIGLANLIDPHTDRKSVV